MITKWVWENFSYTNIVHYQYITPLAILRCLILSIISIPIDIILLPLEIIALFVAVIICEL